MNEEVQMAVVIFNIVGMIFPETKQSLIEVPLCFDCNIELV